MLTEKNNNFCISLLWYKDKNLAIINANSDILQDVSIKKKYRIYFRHIILNVWINIKEIYITFAYYMNPKSTQMYDKSTSVSNRNLFGTILVHISYKNNFYFIRNILVIWRSINIHTRRKYDVREKLMLIETNLLWN